MRAVQIVEYGGYDQLQLVELPIPTPEPGQVVVKMTVASINPLDNVMRLGIMRMGKSLPLILGSEGVGIVASEGTDLAPGTRVLFRHPYFLPCGGTWQEYVVAPRSLVAPLPDGTSDLEAAALRTAYATAYLALMDSGQFQPGQVVFAPGVGGSLGNAVVQLGKVLGASRVITTVGTSAKAQFAREQGYTDVIDLTQESVRDGINRLTNNTGVDLMIDGLGGEIAAQGLEALKMGGRAVLLGVSAGSTLHLDITHFLTRALSIIAHQTALVPLERANEAFDVYFHLWLQGRIKPLIDRTFPIEQIVEAQRYQVEGRPCGKVLLTFD